MRRKILLLILLAWIMPSFAMESLIYMLRGDSPDPDMVSLFNKSIQDIQTHITAVNIITPQAYIVDREGIVWGNVDPQLINFVAQNHLKLMPLVTNQDFDREKTHQFLQDEAAQARAIKTLVQLAQTNHFYGLQIDFEAIGIEDRSALTLFYKKLAEALHRKDLVVSFTVFPITSDSPQSVLQRLLYENWAGCYDYKELGKIADFITIMTYDQHTDGTTPGPVAAQPWVEAAVQYALKRIPAKKISLGIPAYSDYWYVGRINGGSVRVHLDQISYNEVQDLLKENNANLLWYADAQVHYALYMHQFMDEFIFVEDATSFKHKLSLITKYHLRGFSLWRIGMEDPQIWSVMNF